MARARPGNQQVTGGGAEPGQCLLAVWRDFDGTVFALE